MNLHEHFPKDRTARYVWQKLLECQRGIRDGGHYSAGLWIPHRTKKAVEIEKAKAELLAKILANCTKAGPCSAFYFLNAAEEQVNA